MLKTVHPSAPRNPLIAEPMYLAGYIERLGTGTVDIVEKTLAADLPEPKFIQETIFRTVLFRKATEHVTEQPTEYVTPHVTPHVNRLIWIFNGEPTRQELMEALQLRDREYFRKTYLQPALKAGFIEMTNPNSPRSRYQTYRLTPKGLTLQKILTTEGGNKCR